MDWKTHMGRIFRRFNDVGSWTPAGGQATSVQGLFTDSFNGVNLSTGRIDATDPTFSCMADDVPNIAQGDAFVFAAVNYTVANPEPDSATGTVKLQLRRV